MACMQKNLQLQAFKRPWIFDMLYEELSILLLVTVIMSKTSFHKYVTSCMTKLKHFLKWRKVGLFQKNEY